MKLHWNKYAAELIGTACLTFAVLASLQFPLPLTTPVIAGLTLGLFVYTVGTISGAHINPAVTIGLLSIRKIHLPDAIAYIVAQCGGAVLAMTIFPLAFGRLPAVTVLATPHILLAEALGAAILLFGISAVAYNNVHAAASGLTIGCSLLLGILLASPLSNGVLNPAVALGIGSVSWAYLLGPIVGSLIACQLYRWLARG